LPGLHLGVTKPNYTRDEPYTATLYGNQRITAPEAIGDVRHLILSVDPAAIAYTPGDALGVWFRNDPALVDAVLAVTGLEGDSTVPLERDELELRQALNERLELTLLHPPSVRGWAKLADDASLQAIVADKDRLNKYVQGRQILDLISEFPARPDATAFARLLPPLKPRFYSIASSQAEYEDEVHLTVGLVRYRAFERDHLGGCSGFLVERLDEDEPVDVYVVENRAFRLPEDGTVPIIMIGAGAGVAPFRAFLQQRAANGYTGRNWLIFGNRNFHADFLYQVEWLKYRKAGLLNRADLAFSRDQADKIYVQHRIRENAENFYRWLEGGAHLYVCGSIRMGKAVQQALEDVVYEQVGQSLERAREFIENLRCQGRYHRDVY